MVELEDTACPNLAEDLPRLRGNYLGMLRLIDDQTKRLIEGFKAAGLYENTIFVVLSDHGDYCGEYGLIRKGAGVPECLTRIPRSGQDAIFIRKMLQWMHMFLLLISFPPFVRLSVQIYLSECRDAVYTDADW